jgi:signal transduction histidine kinase
MVSAVTAALAVYLGRGYPGGPVFVSLFIALYWLATRRGRRVAVMAAVAAAGALVVVGEVAGSGPGVAHLVFVGWAAAAVFFGDAVRTRRAYLAGLEERAVHLEQSREDEARRRVAEERLRIAQDLHDSVAHSMATINVQAGVAEHVIDRHPDRARAALGAIRRASGEVLDELAALLGLVRLGTTEDEPRTPTPGPVGLPSLLESLREAGLEVDLRVDGDLAEVPQPVGVALYRIVQESLTNVVRHARPGATATVTIRRDGDGAVAVEVADDGTTHEDGPNHPSPSGAGIGLVGMRERAAATGGTLSAGRRPGGGFLVRASWPNHR